MRVKHPVAWLAAWILAAAAPALAAPYDSLADAIRAGDKAALRALLQKNADVNAASLDGSTPLLLAAQLDDLETVDLLLRAGADPKTANRYGVAPLFAAATTGNAAIIEKLLAAGADPNTALPEGETTLMTAARTGSVTAIKVLVARGADVNAKERWRGQTALMWAAAENNAAAVKALVETGADPAVRSNGGFTPLLFAVRAGRMDSVRALIDAGANVNDAIQAAPRPAAVAGAALQGGGRNRGGGAGMSALVLAILNGHFELGGYLLDKGANPNAAEQGWTPLHQIAWTRRPPVQHGLPPAVGSGTLDSLGLAKKLLEKGANPNVRQTREPGDGARNLLNRIGSTPLLQAAKLADVPYMRLLLANGADPSIPTEEGATVLMAAAGVGIWHVGENAGTNEEALEAVKLAIEAGNDVNAVDANGDTALHGAAHRGANDIVTVLVEKGAKLDVPNKNGWTPYIIADGVFYPNTWNRHLETAEHLLKVGANPGAGKRRPEDLPPSEELAAAAAKATR
jgi:ankyrin repeat protein